MGVPRSRTYTTHGIYWGFSDGILGDQKTHKYQLYRTHTGISHRGTLGPGYIQLSLDRRCCRTSHFGPLCLIAAAFGNDFHDDNRLG